MYRESLNALLSLGLLLAVSASAQNLLEVSASGMRFQGDSTVPAGWTTIRMNNLDSMLHFAIVVRLPDGVSVDDYHDDLGEKFQRGYEFMLAGKNEEAGAVFGAMPPWVGQISYWGGPGFASGHKTAEATVFLEPGNYVLECYIKTNGVFHSYSAQGAKLAMLHPLTVTEAEAETAEPQANATLTISDSGTVLTDGTLVAGENNIRVIFETQNRYPSFTGQDVHLMRVSGDGDTQKALNWMDWRTPHGLLVPAPVEFLGGLNDMPAGETGYFKVNLTPGKYAFIGETDEADKKGLLMAFEVTQ